jgi:hypothetical protein
MRYAGPTARPELALAACVAGTTGLRPLEAATGGAGRLATRRLTATLPAVAVPPVAAATDPHLRQTAGTGEDAVTLNLQAGLLPAGAGQEAIGARK